MKRLAIPAYVIVSLVLFVASTGSLNWFDDAITGQRFKLATRPPTGNVALVEIDPKSLEAIGTWPWPRSVHAKLIDELTLLGAAEIAFDIDFSARSTPEDDQALETALERAGGGVILAIFDQASTSTPGETALHANRPLDRFARNAWAASVNVFAESDGLVRRFPYGQTSEGESVPSIPAMLSAHFGTLDGSFAIDFGIAADRIERISVIDVLRGEVPRERIEGRKFIVGAGAAELRDVFAVPAYGIMSGPLLQVLATETLLQGRALSRTGIAVEAILLLLFTSIALLWLRRRGLSATLLLLAGFAFAAEAAGLTVQIALPLVLETAALHLGLALFALLALAREIDLRRLLLFISRRETRNTRTLLDQVIADNFDGVLIFDESGRVVSASLVAAQVLGRGSEAELQNLAASEFLPDAMSKSVAAALDALAAGRTEVGKTRETTFTPAGSDTESVVEFVVTPSRLEGGETGEDAKTPDTGAVCLTFRDISARRQAETRLNFLARFDTLTGLANRNEFSERLDAAIVAIGRDGRGGAVLCFDLDRFRNVNDTLGHAIGDLVLGEVTARVKPLLQEGDVFARFGANSYAILRSRSTMRTEAARLARKIIDTIGESMTLQGHRVIMGASVGISVLRTSEIDAEQVLRHAETALYRAKANGGAGVQVFDPEMDAAILERRALEMELWQGFERGEFEVVYQPQCALADRIINGVEALVRWRHPTRGYVSPAVFVPVAEEIGLIEKIGDFVLRQACRDTVAWPRPIKVAVNLSSVQFQRGDLVATVDAVLKESGLPLEQFELEITESLLMDDDGRAEAILAELHAKGIRFALDDFGTGYSSLSYIRRFPIHKIKIDRAFVTGLPDDLESLAIIRAIATLADSLNLTTTVEGIETEAQAQILYLAGCVQAQGYLFGKPQSAADIAKLLTAEPSLTASVA